MKFNDHLARLNWTGAAPGWRGSVMAGGASPQSRARKEAVGTARRGTVTKRGETRAQLTYCTRLSAKNRFLTGAALGRRGTRSIHGIRNSRTIFL